MGGMAHVPVLLAQISGAEYYCIMAKAQGAPVSIRPGDERLARVDAYAKAQGLKRHAAILRLLDEGLGVPPLMIVTPAPTAESMLVRPAAPHAAAPLVASGKSATVQIGPIRAVPGALLKKGRK